MKAESELGPAQGEINRPKGQDLALIMDTQDISPLANPSPTDLKGLSTRGYHNGDLASISHLTDLEYLALDTSPKLDDSSLKHLQNLSSLRFLDLKNYGLKSLTAASYTS